MNLQITSDNVEISPAMRELVLQKLPKLDQKLNDVPEDLKSYRVVLNTAPDDTFEAKVEVSIRNKGYYAKDVNFSLETALIAALEEVEKQVEKALSLNETKWQEKRELKRSLPEEEIEEDLTVEL